LVLVEGIQAIEQVSGLGNAPGDCLPSVFIDPPVFQF
jgi:hypothetical protein